MAHRLQEEAERRTRAEAEQQIAQPHRMMIAGVRQVEERETGLSSPA